MAIITRNPDGSIKTVDGVDINIILDQEFPNSLTSSWPSVTGDSLKFNAKQFLADLANMAGNDNWGGFVRNHPIDFPEYKASADNSFIYPVDPQTFAKQGDKRLTLGKVLKDAYDTFIPRINAYTEVVNAGGCQVINDYICDTDGNPIVKATFTCDPGNSINLEMLKPQEVVDFVKNSFNNATKAESDSFIKYLKDNYLNKGWTMVMYDIPDVYTFYIKISKSGQKNIFKKYFYDQKDYVSKTLKYPLVIKKTTAEIEVGDDLPPFIQALKDGPPVFNA